MAGPEFSLNARSETPEKKVGEDPDQGITEKRAHFSAVVPVVITAAGRDLFYRSIFHFVKPVMHQSRMPYIKMRDFPCCIIIKTDPVS